MEYDHLFLAKAMGKSPPFLAKQDREGHRLPGPWRHPSAGETPGECLALEAGWVDFLLRDVNVFLFTHQHIYIYIYIYIYIAIYIE